MQRLRGPFAHAPERGDRQRVQEVEHPRGRHDEQAVGLAPRGRQLGDELGRRDARPSRSVRARSTTRRRIAAAISPGGPAARTAPETSRNASSSDSGSTSGVMSRSIAMTCAEAPPSTPPGPAAGPPRAGTGAAPASSASRCGCRTCAPRRTPRPPRRACRRRPRPAGRAAPGAAGSRRWRRTRPCRRAGSGSPRRRRRPARTGAAGLAASHSLPLRSRSPGRRASTCTRAAISANGRRRAHAASSSARARASAGLVERRAGDEVGEHADAVHLFDGQPVLDAPALHDLGTRAARVPSVRRGAPVRARPPASSPASARASTAAAGLATSTLSSPPGRTAAGDLRQRRRQVVDGLEDPVREDEVEHRSSPAAATPGQCLDVARNRPHPFGDAGLGGAAAQRGERVGADVDHGDVRAVPRAARRRCRCRRRSRGPGGPPRRRCRAARPGTDRVRIRPHPERAGRSARAASASTTAVNAAPTSPSRPPPTTSRPTSRRGSLCTLQTLRRSADTVGRPGRPVRTSGRLSASTCQRRRQHADRRLDQAQELRRRAHLVVGLARGHGAHRARLDRGPHRRGRREELGPLAELGRHRLEQHPHARSAGDARSPAGRARRPPPRPLRKAARCASRNRSPASGSTLACSKTARACRTAPRPTRSRERHDALLSNMCSPH